MKINLPIRYSQFDPQWAKQILGYNQINSEYDIYNYGCLLSCLSSVDVYFGGTHNPRTLNEKLKELGGFVEKTGYYKYGFMPKINSRIGSELRTVTPSKLTDAQMQEIKAALDSGYPVMVQVDYNPDTVKMDQHFVLLVDYHEENFMTADPLGGINKPLNEYCSPRLPTARDAIYQYIIFTKKKEEEPKVDTKIDTPIPQVQQDLGVTTPPVTQTYQDKKLVDTAYVDHLERQTQKWHDIAIALTGTTDPFGLSVDEGRKVLESAMKRLQEQDTTIAEYAKQVTSLSNENRLLQERLSHITDEVIQLSDGTEQAVGIFITQWMEQREQLEDVDNQIKVISAENNSLSSQVSELTNMLTLQEQSFELLKNENAGLSERSQQLSKKVDDLFEASVREANDLRKIISTQKGQITTLQNKLEVERGKLKIVNQSTTISEEKPKEVPVVQPQKSEPFTSQDILDKFISLASKLFSRVGI